jgi:hypothetical protein
MSLSIHVDNVTAVLLSDGWHEVDLDKEGVSSFDLDAYEYLWGEIIVGHGDSTTVPTTGFGFMERGTRVCGPFHAIHAIKESR